MPRKKTTRKKAGLTQNDKAAVSRSVKQARLVDASRKLARIAKHIDPNPGKKAARTRLEKSLTKWMVYHGKDAFSSPFSDDHKKVIAKIERAINEGGLFALAMPRGHGKSTILKWATLYCMLTGRRNYVVIVAATAEMAQSVIEFVRQQLEESDTLHKHYPHVTTYARATGGKAQKAKYQLRADGKSSGIQWTKNTLVLPEVLTSDGKEYKSNGSILEGHGLTGAIRGKWKDSKSGKVLRPDFVLLDDPQTRESAESESQCNMRERIITGDVLGLAGPKKKIAAVMPCTIVRGGDLAARFLDKEKHPEWSGETCKLVKSWPDEQDGLWVEYANRHKAEMAAGRGLKVATQYYKDNKAKMDKGAIVSWKHRVRDGEISAIQTAENLLLETGDQFYAEYQNEPLAHGSTIFDLTPELICSRVSEREAGQVPEWAKIIVAATDINHYGLHTVIVAFANDHTAAVVWYGRADNNGHGVVPKNATEAAKKKFIYEALVAHGNGMMQTRLVCEGQPAVITAWVIDGGYCHDVVQRYATEHRRLGVSVIVARGFAALTYRPYGKNLIGAAREQCHATEWPLGKGLAFNADYWREITQRAWLGDVGAPGTCSLPKGHHQEFAEQICREKLIEKVIGKSGWFWRWATTPGWHDYGDSMTMAYAGAAWNGIGTGTGAKPLQRVGKKRRMPKVRHIKV